MRRTHLTRLGLPLALGLLLSGCGMKGPLYLRMPPATFPPVGKLAPPPATVVPPAAVTHTPPATSTAAPPAESHVTNTTHPKPPRP